MASWTVFAAAAWLALGAGAPAPKILSPKEILKRLESSSTRYVLEAANPQEIPRERYAEIFWPRGGGKHTFPTLETRDGRLVLVEAAFSDDTLRVARAAEPVFQAGDYEAAAALYEQGLAKEPRSFLLLSHLGDCHYHRGRYEEALRAYERASALMPTDHRLWWYRGQALAHLDRRDEARDAFVEALARKPGDELVVGWLARNAEALGLRFELEPFAPLALARREGDAVRVYLDPSLGAHWVAYGICKALWLGEPSRRKEATGSEQPAFTSFEERECLASLLSTYVSLREEEQVEADPALDRLLRVVKDGLVEGFVLYELGSRISPHVLLLAGPEPQEQVRQYLRRYVLVRAQP